MLSFSTLAQVDGLQITEHYGITLSKNCITMLKNNFTTNCPTYEQLMVVFNDSTNPEISGEFGMIDGVYQREIPTLKNHWKYYDNLKEPTIWIDPPGDVLLRAKIITIENNFKEYPLPRGGSEKTTTITNQTQITVPIVGPGYKDFKVITVPDDSKLVYYLGNERYVSRTCTKTIIDASSWVTLLGDSMQLMKHNCDLKYTNHQDKKEVQIKQIEHDITTSYNWQLQQYVKMVKENCLQKFMGCTEKFDFKNAHNKTIELTELGYK